MNILIDMDEVSPQRLHSSIPIYIMRFVSAIKTEDRKNYILLVSKDIEGYIRSRFPDFRVIVYRKSRWVRIKGFKTPLCYYYQYKLRRIIARNNVDCVFIPTDYQWFTSFKFKCRKVIVVHDLKGVKQCVDTWRLANCALSRYRMYEKAFKYADEIIAISKYTKQDIETYYPAYPSEKIRVVYNSVVIATEAWKPKNFQALGYVLYVNTLSRYKNVFTLVKAFSQCKDCSDRQLVVVGKENEYWCKEVMPYIRKNGLENRVIRLQDLTDEELRYLYEHAALFVTPSLHEGFGYTPIEAAMCGCPVVSSIQEALPDSTQGLLNYYQPAMDVDALREKILFVLNNPPGQETLLQIAKTYRELYAPARQVEKIQMVLFAESTVNSSTSIKIKNKLFKILS